MHTNDKNQVYKLISKIDLKPQDIQIIKKIHHGFTNQSFYIKTKTNKEFQVRIGDNNEIVNRKIENVLIHSFLKDQFLYYNVKNGDAIKKWIKGRDLKKDDLDEIVINRIIDQINLLHQTNLKDLHIEEHNYFVFLDQTLLEEKHYQKYVELVKELKDKKDVLSHNDLNLKNILINEQKEIFFIDFEWARINYWWWDFANFIREVNLSKKLILLFCKKLNLPFLEMVKYLYICTNFAVQWSYKTTQSKKVLAYRTKTFKILEKYYRWLIKARVH